MTIIQISETNGLHPVQTWHMGLDTIPEGWALVPEDMVEAAFASGGFCEIATETQTIDGMECAVLTSLAAIERPIDMTALREEKLQALSAACNAAITAGCDVMLSDGKTHHFSLEETDQINLSTATMAVQQGVAGFPYHADGELCTIFSAADILAVSNAAAAHKTYHTTYCNHLLSWARRTEDVDELAGITYGTTLPDDLAANMTAVLWLLLGMVYLCIEILWRGYTHRAMLVVGGLCGVLIGMVNQVPRFYKLPVAVQSIIGACIVLVVELVAGLVLNVWLGLGIWDYSNMPMNIMGQICPQYAVLWTLLMPLAIWAEDTLRWLMWFWHGCVHPGRIEDKPSIPPYTVRQIYTEFITGK